jgi:phosphatidylglycerophosphate synthase
MGEVLPFYVLLLNGLGIFWYNTLDSIDGKHARKTGNCSPLG